MSDTGESIEPREGIQIRIYKRLRDNKLLAMARYELTTPHKISKVINLLNDFCEVDLMKRYLERLEESERMKCLDRLKQVERFLDTGDLKVKE